MITQNGAPRAVMLDPESYDRMRTAIGMLKLIAHGEEAVRAGHSIAQNELFGER